MIEDFISDRPIKIETIPPMKEIKQNQKLRELIENYIKEIKDESEKYKEVIFAPSLDGLQKLLEESKK